MKNRKTFFSIKIDHIGKNIKQYSGRSCFYLLRIDKVPLRIISIKLFLKFFRNEVHMTCYLENPHYNCLQYNRNSIVILYEMK